MGVPNISTDSPKRCANPIHKFAILAVGHEGTTFGEGIGSFMLSASHPLGGFRLRLVTGSAPLQR